MLKDFLADFKVRTGIAIFAVFLAVAAFGPWFVTNVLHTDPNAIDYNALHSPPTAHHLLGTTNSGQDVLAQLIAGCRGSVEVGLISGLLAISLAALIGVSGSFLGGRVDQVLNSLTNLFATLPSFPLTLVVAGYVSNTGVLMIAFLIGIFEWPGGARYLRAQTLSIRNRDFTVALRMIGEKRRRLIFVEVMPHLTGILSAMFLRAVVAGIFAEAGLRFLGIGGANTVTWGTMIQFAQQQSALLSGMWWYFVPPGLCIALLGTATALVNFGIDEISNPSLKSGNRKARRRAAQILRQRVLTAETREAA